MFDYSRQDETRLHRFVLEHRDGLLNAADTLGGERWMRRTTNFIDEVQNAPHITRRLWGKANDLLALLRLESVDAPGSEEAYFFGMLDPASPIVEEICLLTDLFSDCLSETMDDTTYGTMEFEQ